MNFVPTIFGELLRIQSQLEYGKLPT